MAGENVPKELLYKLNEKFEIEGYLGSGGGGVVLKAKDRNIGRDVAIKVIKSTIKSEERKKTEARILAELKNDHLPSVYLYDEAYGYSYMVMEYIRGKNLKKLLSSGHIFSAEETLDIAKQLCDVVSYLHDRPNPIIHGDIKPENIILNPDGRISLIDFNISGISEDGVARTYGFTSGFSAPEQAYAVRNIKASMALKKNLYPPTELITGETDIMLPKAEVTGNASKTTGTGSEIKLDRGIAIDTRSDVYSIGATLYYIYFGRHYEGEYLTEEDTELGKGFSMILERSLDEDPERRFHDATEMKEALSKVYMSDKEYRVSNIVYNVARILLLITTVAGVLLVIYGFPAVEREKQTEYNSCLDRMGLARDAADRISFMSPYEEALGIFPQRAEAYCQYASLLYEMNDYAGAVSYINKEALTVGSLEPDEYVAELYYILGNSCYETGDYTGAANALSQAVDLYDGRPEYYVDLAYAYIACGDTNKAREVVENAEEYGIGNDKLFLLKGEILVSEERYRAAYDAFNECIEATSDDATRMRAYVEGSRALTYLGSGFYEENAAFLSEGLENVSSENHGLILEQLAQISIDNYSQTGDDASRQRAIGALSSIIDSGWDTDLTYSNLAVLYQQGGDYEQLRGVLDRMRTEYPDSYMTYKRLAFYEADIQSQLEEEARDYTAFVEYCDRAEELYAGIRESRENDTEMNSLRDLRSRLSDGGWF
ncbi:MAG: protein kinase [Clostridiales bacterium]|nr:protein kinase [Clostridiales bacterium]